MADIPGDVPLQDFASESDEEDITPKLFDMSELTEGASIYYIFPGATKLFHPKEGQNLVIAIKIRVNLCFSVAKNVAPIEDILEMHNVDNTLNEAAIYNARIFAIALPGISKSVWIILTR